VKGNRREENILTTMTSLPDYDVLIIGAGLSGCYACYRMQQLNMKVKVIEAGSSVGGTWYWSISPDNHSISSTD
jgi:cation diffusion facilitator CzcD-associated flavoprotein CzcO